MQSNSLMLYSGWSSDSLLFICSVEIVLNKLGKTSYRIQLYSVPNSKRITNQIMMLISFKFRLPRI